MASRSKDTNIGMLFLITIVGLVLGSLLSVVIDMLISLGSSEGHNVLSIFTWSVPIGIGFPDPVTTEGVAEAADTAVRTVPGLVDLKAIKFHFGFQLNINAMSFLGLWIAHKFYKSNR